MDPMGLRCLKYWVTIHRVIKTITNKSTPRSSESRFYFAKNLAPAVNSPNAKLLLSLHTTTGTHVSFIFRGSEPMFVGLQTFIFDGFGFQRKSKPKSLFWLPLRDPSLPYEDSLTSTLIYALLKHFFFRAYIYNIYIYTCKICIDLLRVCWMDEKGVPIQSISTFGGCGDVFIYVM